LTKGKVRYRSAYDENNNLVTLTPGRRVQGMFKCPNPKCNSEMIPRQGEHNAWHFAHVGKECDYDHYLHTVAELRIQEWYNKADNVNIKIPIEVACPNYSNCKFAQNSYYCRRDSTITYNLKKYWGKCEREFVYYKDGRKFVADLFCKAKNGTDNPLFIEICVTSPCKPEKINSKIRIIEVSIDSEDDVDSFINKDIEVPYGVEFHNFGKKSKIGNLDDFGQILNKVVVWENYKAGVNRIVCKDVENRKGLLELTVDSSLDLQELYKYGSSFCIAQALAYKYIPNYRSCYVCVNCRKSYGQYICVAHSPEGSLSYCKNNDARQCSFFKPDESIINRRICVFEEVKSKNPVDLYIKQNKK
jgi:hypothetical protein